MPKVLEMPNLCHGTARAKLIWNGRHLDSCLFQAVLVFLVLNLPRIVLMAFEVERIIMYEKCLVSNWKLFRERKICET